MSINTAFHTIIKLYVLHYVNINTVTTPTRIMLYILNCIYAKCTVLIEHKQSDHSMLYIPHYVNIDKVIISYHYHATISSVCHAQPPKSLLECGKHYFSIPPIEEDNREHSDWAE